MVKLFCFIAVAGTLALGLAAQAELVSGVTVVVDDSVITYGEIAEKVEPKLDTALRLYGNDRPRLEEEVRRLRDDQVEEQVERKLILHEFTAASYVTNVLESFIDDMIKKNIRRDFYGDRARLIKTLQAEGRTYEMYRREERENFIVNYMGYQNVSAPRKTLISPLKIEQYYKEHQGEFKVENQVKLRMIIIDQPVDGPAGQARRKGDEVLSKIDTGVAFEEMAKIYSSGPQQTNGGEYGWVNRSFLKPELADAAFSLKPGQHSGVIELPEACYIVLVEEARDAHVKPLNDVRVSIEQTLTAEKRSTLRKQWIERMRVKSYIQYY